MSGDERAPGATRLSPPRALLHGEMEVLGLMPNASNYTFLARCTDGDDQVLAVYKPRRGEIPLWDFPDGTLHRREVAAYELARMLGWPNVPPTIVRDGPEGEGSAQLFVPFDPDHHFFTLEERHAEDFRRVALFDVVVNNADRKAGHCLLSDDDHVYVVDHGVCFSVEPKLRTVIWSFVGEAIDPVLLEDLTRLRDDLSAGSGGRLVGLLDPDEIDAVGHRTSALVRAGRFPGPAAGTRPYPWPPI